MRIDHLEMLIELAISMEGLEDYTYEDISKAIKKCFNEDVSVDNLQTFFSPEVQDRLAQLKAWGFNY